MRFTRFHLQILLSLVIALVTIALVYFFYLAIRDRLTEDLRLTAQTRSSLFAGSIRGDMQRHIIVPRILSQDEEIADSFINFNLEMNEKLARLAEELGAAVLYTVSKESKVINVSEVNFVSDDEITSDLWLQTLESGSGSVYDIKEDNYYYAAQVESKDTGEILGLLVVKMNFQSYVELWGRLNTDMVLMRANGEALIATRKQNDNRNIRETLGLGEDVEIQTVNFDELYTVNDEDMFVVSSDVGVNGWRLLYFLPAAEARQMINGVMALMITALGFLLVFVLYLFSRRAARSSTRFRRESEELRALNTRLITEIEQRRLAEANLQSAEQSLEQSSKLAVIGQMSAAVGHELNQPLAAMRTYLAGVRMLLRRSRFFEAGQNLNRIEDLLDRMGSITRQMRSFARAQENESSVFDLNQAMINAFSLMAPQLGQMQVEIRRDLPEHEVYIQGDMIRVEQILVNILRNALEAVEGEEEPLIEISLRQGENFAHIAITDNGIGIEAVDQLFEPFYTTKAPGEGLGLGLAISASYARDMGGNLLARKNQPKGAIFELNLPLASPK